ncbi:gliding motility-associated C-terminal domain-containing protein [Ohtaekwangia sp.]|uniref:T9SS type B sorting domain-containing protein n=1 Tax=Ohtaekwangia sp. TaxID=2066019 RepID=UPI002FDDF197
MKRFLVLIFCLVTFPVAASHIVGGEFELQYAPIASDAFRYKLNLIIYFDEINGLQDNKLQDKIITARIFRYADNAFIRDVSIPFIYDSLVKYTQPKCTISQLKTSKMFYSTYITLDSKTFSHPDGYYIIWERCCRNYTIANISSTNPQIDPSGAAGQTFYLKFPPVMMNGKQFINSTPHLFPPLSDYACVDLPYYADFAGTDEDGDSLAYTMVTPFSTHTTDAYPPLNPAPYPEVKWRNPFNVSNVVNGHPTLHISNKGLLTVTPSRPVGLFVFAVRCEEFRNGIKIGEARRDFQMLVVDCPIPYPPEITGKKLTDATYTYKKNMTVSFANTVSDADRCIEIQVYDKDATEAADNYQENISLKVIPLGFNKNVSDILPVPSTALLTKTDSTTTFRICFDECPYIEGPFTVGIIAYDDACALPLQDTLKVLVNIVPPANHNARYVTADITKTVNEGSPVQKWLIKAVDEDGDHMTQTIIPGIGVDLASAGITVTPLGQQGDTLYSELAWDPRCNVYDFTNRTSFDIKLQVEDDDKCGFSHPDFLPVNLTIVLPGNHKPTIFSPELTNSDPAIDTVNIERKINQSLVFHVNGNDIDNDKLVLTGTGKGFSLADYGITFPGATDYGNVSSLFTWNIRCDNVNLDAKDKFTFVFLVADNENKCRFRYSDTLVVNVTVIPPDNTAPELKVASTNPELVLTADNAMNVTLGQEIDLSLTGIDFDTSPEADLLQIKLVSATGNVAPQGYSFTAAEGRGTAQGTFIWKPECDIFTNGVYKNDYIFSFILSDNRCFNEKGDTVDVNISIKDILRDDTEFLPPNFISPNGDSKNDFFAMMKRDAITGDLVNILPLDNCSGHFEGIVIFNRWGREVFTSASREFRWYAPSEASGVYYYVIKYSDKEYKGIINVSYWEGQSQTQR